MDDGTKSVRLEGQQFYVDADKTGLEYSILNKVF